MIAFRSFRTRLVVLIAALVTLTQAGAFLLVNAANQRNALQQIARDLELSSGVFRRIIDERSRSLISEANLLSGDFAFKEAFATGDPETLLSAMDNHLQRIHADVMVLADTDGRVIASTFDAVRRGMPVTWSPLLATAERDDYGQAAGIVTAGHAVYRMTVVPLFTPDLAAWIFCGFRIDDAFARDVGKISEVSVLRHDARGWHVVASTLDAGRRDALPALLDGAAGDFEHSRRVTLGADPFVALGTPLVDGTSPDVVAVLARALGEELAPFENLRRYLVVLFGAGLGVSLLVAVFIARGVTRPVLGLAAGVRRIAAGDYAERIAVTQQDEIGALAGAFNEMASGLQERERVRNLLGKVVSPAIAEELLNRSIELGGEEREVTILFADVRDFTALCEGTEPGAILDMLNAYLTRVTAVIERHGGVVDKYIGDAVMALFGAPLSHEDDAVRAVRAALEMRDAVRDFNASLAGRGRPPIGIGIGINTARVVAGNMGSEARLNYTVIGDGVNLASRLEGLTRHYGVDVIVSESTRHAAPGIAFREVDRVRVKGKQEAVAIHEPLAAETDAVGSVAQWEDAMARYRSRDWLAAEAVFARLAEAVPGDALARLYAQRCRMLQASPPGADWDGVHVHHDK